MLCIYYLKFFCFSYLKKYDQAIEIYKVCDLQTSKEVCSLALTYYRAGQLELSIKGQHFFVIHYFFNYVIGQQKIYFFGGDGNFVRDEKPFKNGWLVLFYTTEKPKIFNPGNAFLLSQFVIDKVLCETP